MIKIPMQRMTLSLERNLTIPRKGLSSNQKQRDTLNYLQFLRQTQVQKGAIGPKELTTKVQNLLFLKGKDAELRRAVFEERDM